MKRRYDTPESQRLMNAVLDGGEWDTWDLQLQRMGRTPGLRGRHEVRISGPERRILATVYVSTVFDTIFVLGYHIERKGEPTESQRARVNEYVAEIENLERG